MDTELFTIFKDSGIVLVLVYVVINLKTALKMVYQQKTDLYESRITDLKEEFRTLLEYLKNNETNVQK